MYPSARRRSVSQRVQIVVAVADRSDWIGWLVVLDEIVLEAGLVALREDRAEIDFSLPYVHHLVVWRPGRILHVAQGEPMRVALEEVEWISTAEYHPVDVHLEVDERGVCLAQQNIERPDAVDRRQLHGVVVVGAAAS